jgi:hypothetical protein
VELPLFEQVADAVRSLAPSELGELRLRVHARGVKVWFGAEKPPREHYEAQLLARSHVDGREGVALEIGFHAEDPDVDRNARTVAAIARSEAIWREVVGEGAEVGPFFGASHWRRVSEAWLDPDLDDPELAIEVASQLVDYLQAIEQARR